MVVGVSSISLALSGIDSLKGKRAIVKRLIERARSRFNVAAAEVGALDSKRSAVLGFAVVSNDSRHADEMLAKIASFIAGASEAVVVERRTELIHVGDELGVRAPPGDLEERKYYEE
jgi:uncharacterized protein YlxP (DUF503 family)